MKILFHTPTGTTRPYPRSDSEPVVGLSDEYRICDLIEQDRPTYDAGTHNLRRLPEVIDQTAKTVTRGWEVVAREADPIVVTMRSFRLALGRVRYLQLESLINSVVDSEEQYQATTYLDQSATVSRQHPLVLQFAAALGKPDAEVDAIFATAKQLDDNV
jgi:hypothetical protein